MLQVLRYACCKLNLAVVGKIEGMTYLLMALASMEFREMDGGQN